MSRYTQSELREMSTIVLNALHSGDFRERRKAELLISALCVINGMEPRQVIDSIRYMAGK